MTIAPEAWQVPVFTRFDQDLAMAKLPKQEKLRADALSRQIASGLAELGIPNVEALVSAVETGDIGTDDARRIVTKLKQLGTLLREGKLPAQWENLEFRNQFEVEGNSVHVSGVLSSGEIIVDYRPIIARGIYANRMTVLMDAATGKKKHSLPSGRTAALGVAPDDGLVCWWISPNKESEAIWVEDIRNSGSGIPNAHTIYDRSMADEWVSTKYFPLSDTVTVETHPGRFELFHSGEPHEYASTAVPAESDLIGVTRDGWVIVHEPPGNIVYRRLAPYGEIFGPPTEEEPRGAVMLDDGSTVLAHDRAIHWDPRRSHMVQSAVMPDCGDLVDAVMRPGQPDEIALLWRREDKYLAVQTMDANTGDISPELPLDQSYANARMFLLPGEQLIVVNGHQFTVLGEKL